MIIDSSDLPYPPKISEEFENSRAWIPKCNLSALGDKIFRMQNKANKFGMTKITLDILDEGIYSIEIPVNNSLLGFRKDKTTFVLVEVKGEAIKLPGDWELIAVLEHNRIDVTKVTDDETVTNLNVVKVVPNKTCPESFRYAESDCDHCNHSRFRNQTFVLKNSDGDFKQVGSSCIKDFFGSISPKALMGQAKWLTSIEPMFKEYTEAGKRYVHEDDLRTVLAYTSQSINKFGWVSKAKETESNFELCATASLVREQIEYTSGVVIPHLESDKWEKPSEEDFDLADDAIAWISEHDLGKCNDYIYNCLVIAKTGLCRSQDFGIVCSIVGSYKGFLARKKNIEKKEKIVSNFIGEVGNMFNDQVVLEKQIEFGGFYGPAAILKFRTFNGDIVIWKTSPKDVEEGKTYNIVGRIKEHSIFRKDKQTFITRAKFQEA